jgi:phospholipase C
MEKGALPPGGGVFYIRGGYINIAKQEPYVRRTPADKTEVIIKRFRGDDDHPGYSDHQISEGMLTRVINAVASSPEFWRQSVMS